MVRDRLQEAVQSQFRSLRSSGRIRPSGDAEPRSASDCDEAEPVQLRRQNRREMSLRIVARSSLQTVRPCAAGEVIFGATGKTFYWSFVSTVKHLRIVLKHFSDHLFQLVKHLIIVL